MLNGKATISIICLNLSLICSLTLGDESDEIINHINSAQKLWKAAKGSRAHVSWKSYLLGSYRSPYENSNLIKLPKEENAGSGVTDKLPDEFDARAHWPNCTSVRTVWNQGACSSCWAISVASMISDRICVRTHGDAQVNLSAEHLISCCEDCSLLEGCLGGDPRSALWYFYEYGLVSGGQFGSKEGCQPYSLPPCGVTPNYDLQYNICPSSFVNNTPVCRREICDNHYNKSFSNDLYKAESPPYRIEMNDEAIKQEIYNKGPVLSIFLVHRDFDYYKSGIYRSLNDSMFGSASWHSASVIGWGDEEGVPYWTAVNSWGTGWGESGFFRILRGSDECRFESNMLAITPSTNPSSNDRH